MSQAETLSDWSGLESYTWCVGGMWFSPTITWTSFEIHKCKMIQFNSGVVYNIVLSGCDGFFLGLGLGRIDPYLIVIVNSRIVCYTSLVVNYHGYVRL